MSVWMSRNHRCVVLCRQSLSAAMANFIASPPMGANKRLKRQPAASGAISSVRHCHTPSSPTNTEGSSSTLPPAALTQINRTEDDDDGSTRFQQSNTLSSAPGPARRYGGLPSGGKRARRRELIVCRISRRSGLSSRVRTSVRRR